MGLEPIIFTLREWWLNHSSTPTWFVLQEGLEPSTYSLEDCCSIQLSYWSIISTCAGTRTQNPMIKSHLLCQLSYASKIKLDKFSFNLSNVKFIEFVHMTNYSVYSFNERLQIPCQKNLFPWNLKPRAKFIFRFFMIFTFILFKANWNSSSVQIIRTHLNFNFISLY